MSKGDETRLAILERGVQLASEVGLRGLTIGTLAEAMGRSKSGLFAHFKSKDALDAAVLEYAASRFVDTVVRPALKEPRGEPRIRALFDRLLDWPSRCGLPGGCPMIAAAAELDDHPGPARDVLVSQQKDWRDTLSNLFRVAVQEGHLRDSMAPAQFAFELHGIQLAHHHASRLLRDPEADQRARIVFEALLARAKA